MSYILDALRRADAERERGGVPGLHAQPFPPTRDERAAPRGGGPWRWIALGLAAGLALPLALWWLSSGDEPAPLPTAPTAPLATTPAPAPAPPPAPATLAAAPPAVAEPMAPTSPAPRPAATPPSPPPTAAAAAAPRQRAAPERTAQRTAERADPGDEPAPRPAARPRPPAAAERTATARAPAAASPAASAPAAQPPAAAEPARLPSLAELPEPVRRQLPTLQIGGSMYSEAPANRMLIVNGQLLHEGSTVAPGLVLEQIRLKSAVFSFQGQRYEMRY
jgi:general secretion pathway protein B